ncbi:MAG: pyridoxal phosphate-dependent aminotransferase [Firmicutes bacterium]|nr:pyridoxal phosphate-dependent aminotransferase [Bacillota bacterium]
MISNLMRSKVGSNSAIRKMFEEGKKLSAQYGPENVYDFSLGNPNVPAPDAVRDAMIDILRTEDPLKLHGYMSNAGFDETRKAIADDLNGRFGTAYAPSNVVMTAGAGAAMNITMKSMLDPGDEVVVFAPYFLEYNNYITNFGAVPVVVEPDPASGFMPNVVEMLLKITPKTKAVIVNNPNNPTGAVYPEAVIRQLAEALEAKQAEFGTVIYIISDEPYRELVYGDAIAPHIPDIYPNTLVCYSYSKSLSLPGERIGYVLVPPQSDGAEEFVAALTSSNRYLGIVNAPSLMQLAIARCTDLRSNVAFYERNGADLYAGLTAMGYECMKPDGAFYLWVKCPIEDDAAFCEELKGERVLATPGSAFIGPGYFRLSYCVSHETVVNSMPSFKKVAARYFE